MEKYIFIRLKLFLIALLLGLFIITPKSIIAATSSTYDLNSASSFNFRFDGAVAGDTLGYYSLTTADIDNDGQQDIIVGSFTATHNSRSGSGSVYIIYSSLFNTFTSKTIDLANPANWSIRIDGALASDNLGTWLSAGDITGDDKIDLVVGAYYANRNSRSHSGAIYVFNNTLLSQYLSPGKTIDLATSANFSLQLNGSLASAYLGFDGFAVSDINNNNKGDLIVSEPYSNSVYVISDSIIGNLSTTGITLDLLSTSFYNIKYIGPDISLGYESLEAKDVDGDLKADLLIGADGWGSGTLFLMKNSLITPYMSSPGHDIDLSVDNNFSIRFDGAGGSKFSRGTTVGNFDGDSYPDIAVASTNGVLPGYNFEGAVYIILGKTISSLTGTGNTIDMSNPNNYFLRFDGEALSQTSKARLDAGDLNGDGLDDVIIPTMYTDHNGRTDSGSLYVIYSSFMNSFSNTGNVVNLGTSAGYNVMYDGSTTTGKLGYASLSIIDINKDGKKDILVNEKGTNNNSRSTSGSLYLIYNFPHTISLNSISSLIKDNSFVATGTVSASNSVTNIKGVQYSLDNSGFSGTWNDCSATDGAFNSTSENFSCNVSTSGLTDGSHTVRFRAYDDNISYTAISNYASASFTYDHTSPKVDWTDTSGNNKKYESQGGDNVYSKDTLPTFTFSKSSDATSGLTRYEIIVDGNTYITNIDPNKPGDKDYREDDDKYVKYDGDNNISVHAKKDSDKLVSGKAYKWKVRAVDNAGNSTDTGEKILRINTYQANFSGTFFPISLLTIGGKSTNITSIHPDQVPSNFSISSTTPTFYGIAPVGTKVTLKIEKENSTKSGRDLVLNTTSSANESSRFGINVTNKLAKQEYFVNISAVNPQGDYVEIPEFTLKVGGSSTNIIQSVLEPKDLAPVTTPLLKPTETPKPSNKHCFLWWCW